MWNKIQKIYIGSNLVRPKWKPDSNVLAYYPFKDDTIDATWKTTLSWTMVQSWLGYKSTVSASVLCSEQIQFRSFWINVGTYPTSWQPFIWSNSRSMGYYTKHNNSNLTKHLVLFYNSRYDSYLKDFAPATWTWHHLTMGYTGSKSIYSVDWVIADMWTNWGYGFSGYYFFLDAQDVSISKLIMSNRCWSNDEIVSYYNQTKSDYWL